MVEYKLWQSEKHVTFHYNNLCIGGSYLKTKYIDVTPYILSIDVAPSIILSLMKLKAYAETYGFRFLIKFNINVKRVTLFNIGQNIWRKIHILTHCQF